MEAKSHLWDVHLTNGRLVLHSTVVLDHSILSL